MSTFNISSLDSREAAGAGKPMTVRHPVSGEPLYTDATETEKGRPVTITLLGSDSAIAEKIQREAQRRRLKKGFGHKTTPEELDAETLNLLAALTVAWDGIGNADGEIECTTENAKQVYRDFPWIKKQVDEYVVDLGNFLGN